MKIVFDIGGTNMRLASSSDGHTLAQTKVLPTPKKYAEGLNLLVEQIRVLVNNESLESVAGGVPGILNDDKTEILLAANLPDWSGKKIVRDLAQNFSCLVKLENDAALGGLGEAVLGAGKDYEAVLYIAIGTGIGGSWIINKRLAPSEHSFDPGHHIIDPDGPACLADGKAGHWEAYLRQPNFLDVLATGLYNSLLYWPADVLVLGGGVTLNSNWDLEKIQNQLRELMPDPTQVPEIRIAELGDQAGLYGALLI